MKRTWIEVGNLPRLLIVAASLFNTSYSHAVEIPAPGCQPERRTVMHTGNFELATGNYVPCAIDTGFKSGESGLAITHDGTLLRSVAFKPMGIAASSDQGATWQQRPLPQGAPLFISDGYIDPVTDRYFYAGAGNKPVYGSDDKGLTWSSSTFDSKLRQDWPKLFSGPPVHARNSGYPTNIYYCNWTVPLGIFSQTRCFKSTDGGATFTTTGKDPYAGAVCKVPKQTPGVGHGRGIVDAHDGTIYLPVSYCGAMEMAMSHDEGATWTRRTIRQNASSSQKILTDAAHSPQWKEQLANYSFNLVPAEFASGQHSDALAIDGAGNLYAVWVDSNTYLPVISRSTDAGKSWSEPTVFSPPSVVQAVLPSITVTADGKVGISYYGSTDKWSWTGYLTITSDAISLNPIFESAAISIPDQPLMDQPCCWVSGPQEYTAARWGADGSLWAAFGGYTGSFFYARGVVGRLLPQ